MKQVRMAIITIALATVSMFIVACNKTADKPSTETEQQDQQGKEYTSAYVCPMHCKGSGGEEPGKCPACGMDYVKNENSQPAMETDTHQH